MKIAKFNAFCPFELGDQIVLKNEMRIITDIVTWHSLKNQTVTFLYELDNNGQYLNLQLGEHENESE